MEHDQKETCPITVLIARSREEENPTVEVGTFFFEYRLMLPNQKLLDDWQIRYPHHAWGVFYGQNTCALEERRIDNFPSQRVEGAWTPFFFARTPWEAPWSCGTLYNGGTQGCHPLHTFTSNARSRVHAIEQELQRLTEQGLRDHFDARFRGETSRLRRQDRIQAIKDKLLQEYEQANQERLAQVCKLQEEQARLSTGVDAPQLIAEVGLSSSVSPREAKEEPA